MDMSTSRVEKIIQRASADPAFRGRLIWFPELVADEYNLSEPESKAIRTGNMGGLGLPADVIVRASSVFDLHDLSAGE
jgi:hypothetical protein